MMSFQMTLMMGEDDENVDDSGNENAIDADNDNMNTYQSEGDVGGDTYDVDGADTNNAAIDHTTYTVDADKADADDNTKDSNNAGINEVKMPLMMLTLIIMMLDMKPKIV